MSDEDLARYEFKRTIEEVSKIKGRGTELISLYIPAKKQISDVMNYLRNEASQSSNIKSRTTRKNVQSAIESLMSRIRLYKKPPANGMVLFVGHKPVVGDKTEMVAMVIEPPEPITTFYYRCSSEFFLDPLRHMLREKEEYGLVVIDKNEATVGFLKGKHIESYKNFQSQVPGKTRKGGQSSVRFARLREIALHEFFTRVGDALNKAFLKEEENLKGILVGGPARITANRFVEGDYIHHELKKKLVDTFDVGYTDESGLKELVDSASQRLGEIALNKEKKLMDRFFSELIRSDGGLSAYGHSHVLSVLEIGAVDVLLVSEGLRKNLAKMRCPSCEHEFHAIVDQPDEDKRKKEPKVVRCPNCNEDAEAIEEEDLIRGLSKLAKDFGTKMELISAESEQGSKLVTAFGGLAAILRYKLR
jgi:peptide chain release factor subunit 1